MGTPDFAVPSLTALNQSGWDVALVVTQPDRPKGRGRLTAASPVKRAAEALGYPVLQPKSVRSDAAQRAIRQVHPDLLIVAAFGQIIPKALLTLPAMGAVNVHASLLPRYRGPAPIQWAIINMETETGITIMMMDEGVDTGDILSSETISIRPEDTAASLQDRLAERGADRLIQTLQKLKDHEIVPIPQDHSAATYAPRLRKEDGRIDWTLPAARIEAFIRGVTPWPGAFTFLEDKRLKIFAAAVLDTDRTYPPGSVVLGFPDELRIATGRGLLSVLEIQEASGKRMPVKMYLRGCRIPEGSLFR